MAPLQLQTKPAETTIILIIIGQGTDSNKVDKVRGKREYPKIEMH